MTATDQAPGTPGAPPAWLVTDLRPDEIYREPEGPDTCGCDAPGRQVVYTLHFDPPYKPEPDAPRYKQAAHYTGWAENKGARLDARLAKHEAGQGAKLTRAQIRAGGTWRVASVEPGDRNRERQLKKHSAARRCPICKAEAEASARELEPELEAGL